MAARHILHRNIAPVATGLLAASIALQPRTAYAESPEAQSIPKPRKPIYDNPTNPSPPRQAELAPDDSASHSKSGDSSEAVRHGPTPTDRLTVHIKKARLATYEISSRAEEGVNNLLSRAFNLESSFTQTIRSLAPPADVNEPLVPGFIYVLVGTLTGSIVTRRRGLILRTIVPFAFGLTTANYVIPYTTRNVRELVWSYEQKYPELAKAHLEARDRIERFWETGKSHTIMTGDMLRDKVQDARKKTEDWVSKGN